MKHNTKRKKPFHQDVTKWHSNNIFKLTGFDYAIIACNFKQVTKNQIESCRKLISRLFRKTKPRPSFKILCNYSIALTKKSVGARMGRGKGNFKCYVSKISKNGAIFAFKRCKWLTAYIALNRIKYKLPFKLKLISFYKNGYCRYEDRCRW